MIHVTVPLQSGDSFADLNSKRRRRFKFRHWKLCIFSLHLSGKSMFCRHPVVITDFPIASRKLDDKTPLITVHESRVQMGGQKPWYADFEASLTFFSDQRNLKMNLCQFRMSQIFRRSFMSTYFIPALFCGISSIPSIWSGVGFNVERTGFGILVLNKRVGPMPPLVGAKPNPK